MYQAYIGLLIHGKDGSSNNSYIISIKLLHWQQTNKQTRKNILCLDRGPDTFKITSPKAASYYSKPFSC